VTKSTIRSLEGHAGRQEERGVGVREVVEADGLGQPSASLRDLEGTVSADGDTVRRLVADLGSVKRGVWL
jgi:hypothetical protein